VLLPLAEPIRIPLDEYNHSWVALVRRLNRFFRPHPPSRRGSTFHTVHRTPPLTTSPRVGALTAHGKKSRPRTGCSVSVFAEFGTDLFTPPRSFSDADIALLPCDLVTLCSWVRARRPNRLPASPILSLGDCGMSAPNTLCEVSSASSSCAESPRGHALRDASAPTPALRRTPRHYSSSVSTDEFIHFRPSEFPHPQRAAVLHACHHASLTRGAPALTVACTRLGLAAHPNLLNPS
jgi:hypothetical protein